MQKNFIPKNHWNFKSIGLYLGRPTIDLRIIYNTWKIIKNVETYKYEDIEILLRHFLISNGSIEKDGLYVQSIINNDNNHYAMFGNFSSNSLLDVRQIQLW